MTGWDLFFWRLVLLTHLFFGVGLILFVVSLPGYLLMVPLVVYLTAGVIALFVGMFSRLWGGRV